MTMTEQTNPTAPPAPTGANGQPLNPIAAALAGHIAPDPSYGPGGDAGAPPAPAAAPAVELSDEQRAVLTSHGIEVPADGKITVTDHLKLLDALARERGTRKTLEQQQRQQKIEALPPDEQAIERAREEAREEARRELALEVASGRVEAAAAAAGFADPGDAALYVELDKVGTAADAKAAVEALSKAKPHLLKRATASLPQGPQGDQAPPSDPNAWLRKALGA
jgi:hypothetical protein